MYCCLYNTPEGKPLALSMSLISGRLHLARLAYSFQMASALISCCNTCGACFLPSLRLYSNPSRSAQLPCPPVFFSCCLPSPPCPNRTSPPCYHSLSSSPVPLHPSLPPCPRPPLFSSLVRPFGIKRIQGISSAQWPLQVAFNLKVWQGRQSLERFTGVAYGGEGERFLLPILQRWEKKREEKRLWGGGEEKCLLVIVVHWPFLSHLETLTAEERRQIRYRIWLIRGGRGKSGRHRDKREKEVWKTHG